MERAPTPAVHRPSRFPTGLLAGSAQGCASSDPHGRAVIVAGCSPVPVIVPSGGVMIEDR